jgi:hypothetical protein
MATIEEQEKLLQVLKFTPRTYKVSLWGYGGEKVMGTVDRKVWNYCMANQVDLSDIAWGDEDTVTSMGLDPDMLPFSAGSWYECDDLAHVNGASRDAGTLQVEDENLNTVFAKSLEECDSDEEDNPKWACGQTVWVGQIKPGKIVFVGSSNEKGTFFEGHIELTQPFDITKLTLCYDDIDSEEIVNGVQYDGEDIDNWGGSTDGKSSDFTMCRVKKGGDWERYEPKEKDWGHPAHGTSPSRWEQTETFKFKKLKPTIPGYYSVNWGGGSSFGSLYWDGTAFGKWEYGKFNPIRQQGVKSWSGYSWDTSDWVNQPPEPVDVSCDNKKCGWVGHGEQRRRDDEYNDHCPNCDGSEFTWIDYDPNTALGRKNRAKYCLEWDPAVALERIVVPAKNVRARWPTNRP